MDRGGARMTAHAARCAAAKRCPARRPPAASGRAAHGSEASALLALQRSAGNSVVGKLLAGRGQPASEVGLLRNAVQRKPLTGAPVGETKSRIESLETKVKRLENQQKASGHLNSFRDQVLARATAWERAIINVGTAYAMAAKNHTDAVEAKKKVDAIKSQIMFSVLTVATAGAVSWISTAAQAGKETTAILTNVLEDTIQASGGEVFSAVGPGVEQRVPTPSQSTVSMEPLVFQNQRLARLKLDEERAFRYFKEMNDALLKTEPEKWDSYDEAKQLAAYDAWLKEAGLLAGDDKLPSVDEMTAELERGFWAKWAPVLKELRPVYTKGGIVKVPNYISPGSAIEKRWDVLGITKASGVDDFGWWTSDAEIQQIVDWANGYKAKQFVSD